MADKKYYWLKLKRDFFKRHDIRIIEEMPNGKEYLLFYLKLLVESIDHEGSLRFSDTIPYNEQMLSVITNTNVDIVRSAMKLFDSLQMVEIKDDQTIYMEEVQHMIGSAADNDVANRQRRCRERKKQQALLGVTDALQNVTDVVTNDNESKSIEIELDKDIDIDTDKKPQKRFVKPTLDEIKAYCQERGNNVDAKAFFDYYDTGNWKDAKGKPVKNWKQKVITWERSDGNGNGNAKDGHRKVDFEPYPDEW